MEEHADTDVARLSMPDAGALIAATPEVEIETYDWDNRVEPYTEVCSGAKAVTEWELLQYQFYLNTPTLSVSPEQDDTLRYELTVHYSAPDDEQVTGECVFTGVVRDKLLADYLEG